MLIFCQILEYLLRYVVAIFKHTSRWQWLPWSPRGSLWLGNYVSKWQSIGSRLVINIRWAILEKLVWSVFEGFWEAYILWRLRCGNRIIIRLSLFEPWSCGICLTFVILLKIVCRIANSEILGDNNNIITSIVLVKTYKLFTWVTYPSESVPWLSRC
jgi:hypothetical protein